MLTKIIVVVLVVAVGVALFLLKTAGTISGAEAKALVSSGAVLVDVRSSPEYSAGHIEGAVNIPVDELAQRAGELGDKDDPVVVYCRSGMRSGRARRILSANGFTNVENLGAMSRW